MWNYRSLNVQLISINIPTDTEILTSISAHMLNPLVEGGESAFNWYLVARRTYVGGPRSRVKLDCFVNGTFAIIRIKNQGRNIYRKLVPDCQENIIINWYCIWLTKYNLKKRSFLIQVRSKDKTYCFAACAKYIFFK